MLIHAFFCIIADIFLNDIQILHPFYHVHVEIVDCLSAFHLCFSRVKFLFSFYFHFHHFFSKECMYEQSLCVCVGGKVGVVDGEDCGGENLT